MVGSALLHIHYTLVHVYDLRMYVCIQIKTIYLFERHRKLSLLSSSTDQDDRAGRMTHVTGM